MPRHPTLSSRFFPGAEKPPNCAWGFSAPCKNASDGAVAAAPSLQPGKSRQELGYCCACGMVTCPYAACPTAQMKPASSRATATAATVEGLPLLTNLRNFLCNL